MSNASLLGAVCSFIIASLNVHATFGGNSSCPEFNLAVAVFMFGMGIVQTAIYIVCSRR